MNYKLSPSDLTFLYDACKCCFVLKVKHGIRQPSIPIPGVFSAISYLQKEYHSDRRLEELSLGLPPAGAFVLHTGPLPAVRRTDGAAGGAIREALVVSAVSGVQGDEEC